ncbi:MAG: hypothetical protein OQK35_05880 [Alphaproteobacteria bacterium]|nr:hypothetical protein [Alphaproteobacteria bacterium]
MDNDFIEEQKTLFFEDAFEAPLAEFVANKGFSSPEKGIEIIKENYCDIAVDRRFERTNPLINISKKIEKKLWMTEGSYSNPIMTLFRENDEWKCWEILWTLATACKLDLSMEAKESEIIKYRDFGGNFGNKLIVAVKYIESCNAWLFAGPIWNFLDHKNLGGKTGQGATEDLVGDYAKILFGQDEEAYKRWSIHKKRTKRLGGIRAATTKGDIAQRVAKVDNEISVALNVFSGFENKKLGELYRECSLGANHWVGLAQFVILLESESVHRILLGEEQNFPNNLEIFFRPPTLNHADIEKAIVKYWDGKDIILSAIWDKTNKHYSIKFRKDLDCWPSIGREMTGRLGLCKHDCKGEMLDKADSTKLPQCGFKLNLGPLKEIDNLLGAFVDKIQTSRTYFFQERKNLTQFQLEDNLFNFDDQNDYQISIPKSVLPTICHTLNLDVCSIYKYDFNLQELDLLGCYHRDQNVPAEEVKKWTYATREFIRDQGKLPINERGTYPLYRVLQKKREEVISTLMTSGGTRSEEATKLLPTENQGAAQSAVTVPITVLNRPWGVLHLRGSSCYQIRSSVPRWAHEFARQIGNVLFSQGINIQLHKLDRKVEEVLLNKNDPTMAAESAHHEICRQMLSLMMMTAASLWIVEEAENSKEKKKTYKCVAFSDKIRWRESPIGKSFSTEDENSLGAAAVNNEKQFKQGGIDKIGGEYTKILKSKGYKEYCILKLENDGITKGVLWLAGRAKFEFDERWDKVFGFLSAHLGLVLDLIEARSNIDSWELKDAEHRIIGRTQGIILGLKNLFTKLNPIFEDRLAYSQYRPLLHKLRNLAEKKRGTPEELTQSELKVLISLEKLFTPNQKSPHHPGRLETISNIVEILEDENWQLTKMINEDFFSSRKKTGRKDNERYNTDFTVVLRSLGRGILTTDYFEGTEKITLIADKTGPMVTMDRENLDTVLRNLIGNARKYHVGKERPLCVVEDHETYVRFTISNDGFSPELEEGLDLEESLFSLGFRTMWAEKYWRDDGGGIGLFQVKKIVSQWEGNINVKTSDTFSNSIDTSKKRIANYLIKKNLQYPKVSDFCRYTFILELPTTKIPN